MGGVIFFIALMFLIGYLASPDTDPEAVAEVEPETIPSPVATIPPIVEPVDCGSDLLCLGDENLREAIPACRPLIEAQANYNFEWTTSFLTLPF